MNLFNENEEKTLFKMKIFNEKEEKNCLFKMNLVQCIHEEETKSGAYYYRAYLNLYACCSVIWLYCFQEYL